MAVFFQIVEVALRNGLHNLIFGFCYRFMAASSQIARTTPCAFRTGLISASAMLHDLFMATFFQIIEAALFQTATK
jgi:hypothetical protein